MSTNNYYGPASQGSEPKYGHDQHGFKKGEEEEPPGQILRVKQEEDVPFGWWDSRCQGDPHRIRCVLKNLSYDEWRRRLLYPTSCTECTEPYIQYVGTWEHHYYLSPGLI